MLARVLPFLLVFWAGSAWAQCTPSNLNACPAPVFNAASLGHAYDLKAACKAVGGGVVDDSGALAQCIGLVNASYAAQTPAYVHVPAGIFLIKNGTPIPAFAPTVPGAVVCEGDHKSFLVMDPSFAGDLFSWSEAWGGPAYAGPGFNPTGDYAGPTVIGCTVSGSTTSPQQQNAFRFYDRNGMVLMRDVDMYFINGQCISMGRRLNQPVAWMWESSFWDVRCWHSGTASEPAVEISSYTTSADLSAATNEMNFYGINIFASTGPGLVISNPNAFSAARLMNFYGLRVEQSGGDNIDIGLSTDLGTVALIGMYGVQSISMPSGHYGLKIASNAVTDSVPPYAIRVEGLQIGPGAGSALDIAAGANVTIQADSISSTGTNVTVGPIGNVWGPITIDGAGQQSTWSYNIDASVASLVSIPTYNGGGWTNTSTGSQSYQAGGNGNVAGGALGTQVGGALNSTTGLTGTVIGGLNNTPTGAYVSVAGGQRANDFGIAGCQLYSAGRAFANGDSERMDCDLHAVTTTTSPTNLTADGLTPGAANCVNIPSGTAASISIDMGARDSSEGGNSLSWQMPTGFLTNEAGTVAITADTPVAHTLGVGSAATVAATADNTNKCLALTWTAPNTDTWVVHATVHMSIAQ